MIHIPTWRIISILGACLLGVFFALPNFLSQETLNKLPFPKEKVVLGLDLQGGSHLLLEVDIKTVIKERVGIVVDTVRKTLREKNIGYVDLHGSDRGVSFSLRNKEDLSKVKDITFDQGLNMTVEENGKILLFYNEKELESLTSKVIAQSIETIRRRIDETGTREPLIQKHGKDRILVQLPGVGDPSYVKTLIGKTAKLSFHLVENVISADQLSAFAPPPGTELIPGDKEGAEGAPRFYYLVQKNVIVTGDQLVDAQPTYDEFHRPQVGFKFNSTGARRFGETTSQNIGKQLAIVLDKKVLSAPSISTPILGGSGVITGHFSVAEANDLSLLMRSGSLPAPLSFVEERTVGPGLGADSIRMGTIATVASVLLVGVFMLVAYSFVGIIANIAVFFNLAILFGCLSLLGATLTLPGIAGIAISIGMAVDANVLINERIKEELRNGRKLIGAIDAGYHRAMSTIIDSNLTTLIGTALLYYFGSGPVRGLAVTLTLGILISMFTAISVTRLILVTWVKWRKPQTLRI